MALDPLPAFANQLPVQVRFGDGVIGQLADVLETHRARAPIAFVDVALPAVRDALPPVATVRTVAPGEPTLESVDAAARGLDGHGAVVAIGGGSVLDTAKGARLVDPRLTHSLPPAPTLYGGLDVLAQAIGAIAAVTNTPVADALALEARTLVRDALPAVVADGADTGARNRMACASLLAGFAMNLSEAGSDHSPGHALGVRHGTAHADRSALALEHRTPEEPSAARTA